MAVNRLANVRSNTAGECPVSWGTVPDCSVSSQTVQGTDSVLILTGSVTIDGGQDETAEFRFSVNGSATGSPIQISFADSGTRGETHGMTIVWAVDGLSGSSNSFALEWQRLQTIPNTEVQMFHSFQVIEIVGGDAEIIVDQTASDQINAPTTEAPLLEQTGVTVDGTGSILLFLGTVPMNNIGDNAAIFRFGVDDTPEGARTEAGADGATVGDQWSWAGVHVKTGVSAGSHSFQLEWMDTQDGGTPATEGGRLRSFQVVEITAGCEILSEQPAVTTSWTITSGFGNDPTLDVDEVIAGTDSFVMVIANAGVAKVTNDQSVDFSLGIDDAEVGGQVTVFDDDIDQGGSMCLIHVETGLSAASHSFQLRGNLIQGAKVIDTSENRSMFVLEFTVSGDSFTANIADSVGVTDTIAVALGIVVVEADTVGVTDDLSLVSQFFRTEADNVTVTDTIAPSISFVRNFADSVGVTDAITTSVGVFTTLADTVGVTDAIATIVGNIRLLEDTVGVTDVFSRVGTYIRAFADPVGVTDALATAVGKVVAFADSVSVTDTVATSIAFIISLADSVGVTDAIFTLVTITRLLADTVDVTDTISTFISRFVALADTVDVTDILSTAVGKVIALADTVDVTDAIAIAIDYVISIADTVDVTDTIATIVVGGGEFFASIADTVDVTDTISNLSNYARILTDTVDVTDILSKVGIYIRTVTESVIITDIRTHVGTFIVSLQDSVTVTDAIVALKKILVSLSDTVGITDVISVIVTQLVFIISPIELQLKHSRNLQIVIKRGKKIIRELRS